MLGRNFLRTHIVAIRRDNEREESSSWIHDTDQIDKYLDKLSIEQVRGFCGQIKALMKALKIIGKIEVYDSGMEHAYAGTIQVPNSRNPYIFGIVWKKKKLCIIT